MVIPAEVQRYPLGLVDMLEVKAGANPRLLSNTIQTVIDATPLFLAGELETVVAASIGAVLGFQTFPEFNVPAGEIWYVHAYTVTSAAPLAAGQSLQCKATARLGQINAQAVSPRVNSTAGEVFSTEAARDLWLTQGAGLGVVVESIAAGPVNVVAVATISRLRV